MPAFPADNDLTTDPVDIGKFELSHFAGPKAEAGKQQEHGLVTKTDLVIGARANQLLHVCRPEKFGNR